MSFKEWWTVFCICRGGRFIFTEPKNEMSPSGGVSTHSIFLQKRQTVIPVNLS